MGNCEFYQGNFATAILLFQAFTVAYPANIYVDEARFKIGTSYYNAADYANAQTAYTTYYNTYPNFKAAGDAHYWVGRCLEQLLGPGTAAAMTQYCITKTQYPNCSKYGAAVTKLTTAGAPCP
jgi:TolA-binding protein